MINPTKTPIRQHRLRAGAVAAIATALGLAVAGCGGSSSSPSTGGVAGTQQSTGSTSVTTRKVGGVGTVLTNAQGRTLYVFMPDQHRQVTCTGSCASVWPPLKAGAMPSAGGSARTSLLGADPNPAGGRVVTYAHWPLYTYVGDSGAGTAKGEGLNLNGGRWYVVSPSGQLVKKSMQSSAGGGSGTTTSGGGGY